MVDTYAKLFVYLNKHGEIMNISLSRPILQPISLQLFIRNVSPLTLAITAVALLALGILGIVFRNHLFGETTTPNQQQNTDSANNSKEIEVKKDIPSDSQEVQQPIVSQKDSIVQLPSGQYRKTFANGKIEEGEFNSNQVLLKGKRIETDGTVYEGRFVAGILKEGTKNTPREIQLIPRLVILIVQA